MGIQLGQETAAVDLMIGEESGGLLDEANNISCGVHDDYPGRFRRVNAGAGANIGLTELITGNPYQTGHASHYYAIHKLGDVYHGYVGSDGAWHYLNSYTFAGFAPTRIGVRFVHSATQRTAVPGVDFIRAIETDVWPL